MIKNNGFEMGLEIGIGRGPEGPENWAPLRSFQRRLKYLTKAALLISSQRDEYSIQTGRETREG